MIESQLMKPINPVYYVNIIPSNIPVCILKICVPISHLSASRVKENFLAAYIVVRTPSMKTKNPHTAVGVFVKKMIFDQG
jgi:hypothetical protein